MGLSIVAIADSDSHIQWGATLLQQVPDHWERSVVILANELNQSGDQSESASRIGQPKILDRAALSAYLRELQPDVVLLSLSGVLVRAVVRSIMAATDRRPVIVTGLPGISIPPTRRAIAHRSQADLFVLHSRREVREFIGLADLMHERQRFALATLPFLPKRTPGHRADGDVIFAAQSEVPVGKTDRLVLLGWLAEAARRHPYRRVVVKVRAESGALAQQCGYVALLRELSPPAPSNLVVATGAMGAHLETAAALVTIGSTAAIEAVALDVPVLILDDFGVSSEMANSVFVGSGLIGGHSDLVAGHFRHANAGWISDNYFHGAGGDDWLDQLDGLLALRQAGTFALKKPHRAALGRLLWRAVNRTRNVAGSGRSIAAGIVQAVRISL